MIPYSFPYFGPFIFKAQINNQQVEEIKKLCIKDKTKDHSRKLAGHIKEEYEIDSNRYHQVMTPYLDTYCEGYEKFYDKKFKGKQDIFRVKEMANQGSIIVFNSVTFHRVLPVTEGTRYSLVVWALGNDWK